MAAGGTLRRVYTWKYVDGGRGLELVGTGVVLGSEVIQANGELIQEKERLRVVRFAIVLFEATAKLELTTEEIREIVDQDRLMAEWAPHMAVAIVARQDIQYGLARMWEAYVERVGWRTAVHRSRGEAEQWLGQQPELAR